MPRCDNPKKYSSRQSSALGRYPAKSPTSLRNCALKRRSGQTTSGCLSTTIVRHPKRSAAITRKSTAPDSFQLLVDTPQKVPPAFGNIPRKNVYARPLPAAFSHQPRGSPSGPMRRPEKERLQTAFGFWSILSEKPLQPSEIYPGKMFTPVRFPLPFPTDREAPQVARCDS